MQATKEELWGYLQEQLDFMRRSADSFDQGHLAEAKRLAVTVRVLVHQTKNSIPLLAQLKLLQGMGFVSTARKLPKGATDIDGARLLLTQMGNGTVQYRAPTDAISLPRTPQIELFPTWWNQVVIATKGDAGFSRRDVVLSLSDKVGGAHVDPNLGMEFADLVRNNPTGWRFRIGAGEEQRMRNVELHSMRQIAYEVIKSVERKLSRLG